MAIEMRYRISIRILEQAIRTLKTNETVLKTNWQSVAEEWNDFYGKLIIVSADQEFHTENHWNDSSEGQPA